MIRTRNKIYGELNDPNTVVSVPSIIFADQYILGAGNKGITYLPETTTSLLISDNEGNISYIESAPNKAIATDINGDIILIDREEDEA